MTVFQLLELANPSSRLLRLLMETARHSVMVGNLAERAAETIGLFRSSPAWPPTTTTSAR